MSAPSERVWTVDTYFVNERGEYIPDPQALPNALLELNGLMTRVGGVIQMATRRAEISSGRIETIAVVFRWRSFVPLDKAQEAPAHEQDGTAEQLAAPPLPPVADLPATDEPVTAEAVAEEMNEAETASA